ncbi:MAG: hypothetical protein Q8P68_03550 [Candidatus Peregrinibacteria bacterium]|nr:hypothetical protein [Candidatus Peregrinibacteria bacterium]MDZ4245324.1 hypothetical protein [Candidatus Gracilibacteria bacterium]
MGNEFTPSWRDARSIGEAFVGSGVDFMKEAIAKKAFKPLEILEACREYGPELARDSLTDMENELYERGLISIIKGVAMLTGSNPDADESGDVNMEEARKFIREMRMINGEIANALISGVRADIIRTAAVVTSRKQFEGRFRKLSDGESTSSEDEKEFEDFIHTNIVDISLPPMKREDFLTDEKFEEYEKARVYMEAFGNYAVDVLKDYSKQKVTLKDGTKTTKAKLVIRALGNMYEVTEGWLGPDLGELHRDEVTEESDPVILAEFSADIAISITKSVKSKEGATVDDLSAVFEGIQSAFIISGFGIGNKPTMLNSINEIFTLVTANGVEGIDLYGKGRNAIGLLAAQANDELLDLADHEEQGVLGKMFDGVAMVAGLTKYLIFDIGIGTLFKVAGVLARGDGLEGLVKELGQPVVDKIKRFFAKGLLLSHSTDEVLDGLAENDYRIKGFVSRMLTMAPKQAGSEFDEMLKDESIISKNVSDVWLTDGGVLSLVISAANLKSDKDLKEIFTIGFTFWVLDLKGEDITELVTEYQKNPSAYNRPLNGKNLAQSMWEAESKWESKDGSDKSASWESDVRNNATSFMTEKVDEEMPYRTMWQTLKQGSYESLILAPLLMQGILGGGREGLRGFARNSSGLLVALDLVTDLRKYYYDHIEREKLKNPNSGAGLWDRTGGFLVEEGPEILQNRGQELIHQLWTMHLIGKGLPESKFIDFLKKLGFKALKPGKWIINKLPLSTGKAVTTGVEWGGAKIAGLTVKLAGPASIFFGVRIIWRDAILDLEYDPVTGKWEPSGEINLTGRGAAAIAGLLQIAFGWGMCADWVASKADSHGVDWAGKDSKFYRVSKYPSSKLAIKTPEKAADKAYKSRGLGRTSFVLNEASGVFLGETSGFEGSPVARADKIDSVIIQPKDGNPKAKSGRVIIIEEVTVMDGDGSITGRGARAGIEAEHIIISDVKEPQPNFIDRKILGRKKVTTWGVTTTHKLVLSDGRVVDCSNINGLGTTTEVVYSNPMEEAEKLKKEIAERKLEISAKAKKAEDGKSSGTVEEKKPLETKEFKSQYREQKLTYSSASSRGKTTETFKLIDKIGSNTNTRIVEVITDTTKTPTEYTLKYTDQSGNVSRRVYNTELPPAINNSIDNFEVSRKGVLEINSTLDALEVGGLKADHPVTRFLELDTQVSTELSSPPRGGRGGGTRGGGGGGGGMPRSSLDPIADIGGLTPPRRTGIPIGRISVGMNSVGVLESPMAFFDSPSEIFKQDMELAKRFIRKVYGEIVDASGIERLMQHLEKNKGPVLSAYAKEFEAVKALDWAEAKTRLRAAQLSMRMETIFSILMVVGIMVSAYEAKQFKKNAASDTGFEFAMVMAGALPSGLGGAMLGARAFAGFGPVGSVVGALAFGFAGAWLGGDMAHNAALTMEQQFPYLARDLGKISQVFLQGGGLANLVIDGIKKTDGTYGSFIAGETVGFGESSRTISDVTGGRVPLDWHLPDLSKLEVSSIHVNDAPWWDKNDEYGYYRRLKDSELPAALREMYSAKADAMRHPSDSFHKKYEKKKAIYDIKKAEFDTLEKAIVEIEAGIDPTETVFARKYLEREAVLAQGREVLQDFTRANLRACEFPERVVDTAGLALDRLPEGPEGWMLAGGIKREINLIHAIEDELVDNRDYFKFGALKETLADVYDDLESFYDKYNNVADRVASDLEGDIDRLREANYDAWDNLVDVRRNGGGRGYFDQRSALKDAEKAYEESGELLEKANKNLKDVYNPNSEYAKNHEELGEMAIAIVELEKQIDDEQKATVTSVAEMRAKFNKAKSLYGTSDKGEILNNTDDLYKEALVRTAHTYMQQPELRPDKITFTETEARMLMRLEDAEMVEAKYFEANRDLCLLTAPYITKDEFWFGLNDKEAYRDSIELHALNTFEDKGTFDPKPGYQAEDSFIYGHRSGIDDYETDDLKVTERAGYKILDEMTKNIPGEENRKQAKRAFFDQIILAERIFYESSLYTRFGVFKNPTQWQDIKIEQGRQDDNVEPPQDRMSTALTALNEKYQEVKDDPSWLNKDGVFDYDRLIDEFEMTDFG